jgi:hypothetical protein
MDVATTITFAPPLGTPQEEAALCRAAWKAHPSKWGWHIHHEVLAEERVNAIEDRISYILSGKGVSEQALRLRLLRPVLNDAAMAESRKAYDAALAEPQKAYYAALAESQKAYDAALAESQKAYYAALAESHALAESQKAYYAAMAESQKAYDAAMAESQKAYYAALAESQKAYDAALAEPQKAYDAALAESHALECPVCTWDGTSIFGAITAAKPKRTRTPKVPS